MSNRGEARFLKSLNEVIRERALEDLKQKREAAAVNNYVYGGGGAPVHPGGVADQMGNQSHEIDPGDFDYMVNIERQPGEVPGSWKKTVHRTRVPKDQEPPKGKKKRA